MNHQPHQSFSKLSKQEKINTLLERYTLNPNWMTGVFEQYRLKDQKLQALHDEFSENTISNFLMPFGVVPDLLMNQKTYALPMVTEESSVIAAVARASKFWNQRGGVATTLVGVEKLGQVHFIFNGNFERLLHFFKVDLKDKFYQDTENITENMRQRGGGIVGLELLDCREKMPNYYQIKARFDTKESMGANFINSCLEQFAETLKREIAESEAFTKDEKKSLEVIMSILSNYTPECLVRATLSAPLEEMNFNGMEPAHFAEKFHRAVQIAHIDPYRAVTHNKGIMNGVDALVIATGNDFRAVEACAHAYASRNGSYKSLTQCELRNGQFYFWIDLPIAIGVVGGLTNLHPLVKVALEILQKPSTQTLMKLCASVGLLQNFAAVGALVSTGIQLGHMKMHLLNILAQLGVTKSEDKAYFTAYFKDKKITYNGVKEAVEHYFKSTKCKN